MTRIADIIVIGGGIAGISAAACLARGAKVVVLEGEARLGYHSTGRSAAIFIRNYGNATLRALNAAAAGFLDAPEGVSDHSLLKPRGELVIAWSEKELAALEDYADGAEGLEDLTPDEAIALVPILRREGMVRATFERDAQDIDVDRMLQGYARLLKSRAGAVVTGAPVTGLVHHGGTWTATTAADIYAAPVVVNAAGAWADAVARMAGARAAGLTPMRRSAALLPAPAGYDTRAWPLFASATVDWYAKPDAGRLMISPADEDPVEPHDAWPDDMVLAEGLHRYEQSVTVPVTRVERSWAGLRTFAPDRTPVVGFDPERPGFFWLAGQGGYGVQTAPALSDLAAALVLGQGNALPGAITDRLSPARFAGGG